MKRRDFLHSGVIAGAAATVGAPAIAQSRRVLTIIADAGISMAKRDNEGWERRQIIRVDRARNGW